MARPKGVKKQVQYEELDNQVERCYDEGARLPQSIIPSNG
jgi:hypothetical protein